MLVSGRPGVPIATYHWWPAVLSPCASRRQLLQLQFHDGDWRAWRAQSNLLLVACICFLAPVGGNCFSYNFTVVGCICLLAPARGSCTSCNFVFVGCIFLLAPVGGSCSSCNFMMVTGRPGVPSAIDYWWPASVSWHLSVAAASVTTLRWWAASASWHLLLHQLQFYVGCLHLSPGTCRRQLHQLQFHACIWQTWRAQCDLLLVACSSVSWHQSEAAESVAIS